MLRKCFACYLLAFGALSYVKAESCRDYYDYVDTLAINDIVLSSRIELKLNLTQAGVSKEEFVDTLEKTKSNGKKASCGNTRSWVCEIYEGLEAQYEELKGGVTQGEIAGYTNYIGEDLIDLFTSKMDSRQRVLFKMQLVGPVDHVWLIEQMAGPKYRIYQSYNDAYDLYAWLGETTDGMFGVHIILWDTVVQMANDFLKTQNCSLEELENCPPQLDFAMDWGEYIRDYDEEEAVKNFKMAWTDLGSGKVLDKDEFLGRYLYKLSNMTVDIEQIAGTSKNWTEEIHTTWIQLFASPNPLAYPGIPFNMLTSHLPQTFEMQVRVDEFPEPCSSYKILGNSVERWTDPLEGGSTTLQFSTVVTLLLLISVVLIF